MGNDESEAEGDFRISEGASITTALPAISSAAAAASLLGVVAVLAIYGPVTSRLKRHRGLLSAPGTRDCRALRFTPVVCSTSGLFALLRLSARLAAFRSRI